MVMFDVTLNVVGYLAFVPLFTRFDAQDAAVQTHEGQCAARHLQPLHIMNFILFRQNKIFT